MKRPPVLFLLALFFSALTLDFLWGTEIPLGVPGEWVWGRIPINGAELWDVVLGGIGLFDGRGPVLRIGVEGIASGSPPPVLLPQVAGCCVSPRRGLPG